MYDDSVSARDLQLPNTVAVCSSDEWISGLMHAALQVTENLDRSIRHAFENMAASKSF